MYQFSLLPSSSASSPAVWPLSGTQTPSLVNPPPQSGLLHPLQSHEHAPESKEPLLTGLEKILSTKEAVALLKSFEQCIGHVQGTLWHSTALLVEKQTRNWRLETRWSPFSADWWSPCYENWRSCLCDPPGGPYCAPGRHPG